MKLFRATVFLLSSSAWAPPTPHAFGFQPSSPRIHHATLPKTTQEPHCAVQLHAVTSEQTASTTTMPDMQAYANGYKTVFNEISCKLCTPVQGELPKDLVGTYYRCGPAMFSAGSLPPPKTSLVKPKQPPVPDGVDPTRMVLHPFEGDGAVLAVTFHGDTKPDTTDADTADQVVDTNGKATVRFKYVRTNAFTNERKKGKKLYTGMESTRSMDNGIGNDLTLPFFRHHLLPGLNKLRKNTSNTRTVYFGKKLLSLWSGGLPYKLDSLALSTDGRSQLGGAIKREDSALGGKAAIDAARNRILFYGIDEDSGSSQLNLYEFNAKFQPIKENDGVVQVKLPGLAMVHDFAVTENYGIFVQPLVKVNGMQYMLSKEPGKTVALEESSKLVHVVSRASSNNPGEIQSFQIPFDGFNEANLQLINAYEDRDGIIIFDAIRSDERTSSKGSSNNKWPWATSLENYKTMSTKKSLWRYQVHPRNGFISKDCIANEQIYFGVINSQKSGAMHRYIYAAIGATGEDVAPPQGIVKYDCKSNTQESWFPESYEFCGEPMYASGIGDTSEDAGYILSVLFNGKEEESEVVVLRADNISQGPIARIPLGMAVPHGNHGCFASGEEANWTYEEIERRAKLADKMESRGSMWNEVKSDFSGLGLRFDDMEEYFGDLM
eukprot:CCRYP_011949-RC/>CCRYP_011949-RC protein AED:0.03 eAED:0.03 QI:295/0.5/0.66/1/0.5/0.66/3/218/662